MCLNCFPNLKIVRTDQMVLHEEVDQRRIDGLKRRLKKERCLHNPVAVTPLGKNKFLVLDGANRVSAFRQLQIPHLVAQVLEYEPPRVELLTWNHLICDDAFRNVYPHREKVFTTPTPESLLAFVNLYKGRLSYRRVVEKSFATLIERYPDAVCLAVFPEFKPDDIKKFSKDGHIIPAGITRHIIQGRVLSIKVPLSILNAKKTLAEKNRWLNNHIASLVKGNKVRFYQELVFIFDE